MLNYVLIYLTSDKKRRKYPIGFQEFDLFWYEIN